MLLRRDIFAENCRWVPLFFVPTQPHQEQTLTAGVVINTGEPNYNSSRVL